MLNAIIRFSLNNRILVVAITCFLLVYGWVALSQLPVDVFPDLNKPTVNIVTDGHGMAPEEVEVVITRPIELALNGLAGLDKIYSSSGTGLSVIRAEFGWDTDLKSARLAVSEKLQLAKQNLPPCRKAPLLAVGIKGIVARGL
jgi:Cu/Ag efflux pump CusA